jgi:hypothetical protein
MAHAGTPTDLAKQPATSTSTGQGLWKPLLFVILALSIGIGLVLATSFIAGSNHANGLQAVDPRYGQMESLRADFRGIGPAAATVDQRYDQLESLRANFRMIGPVAATVDPRYDLMEGLRANFRGIGPVVGTAVDHRYDQIDALRANLR